MTLDELLRIVRVLSNSCFVRWWAHWNYPQKEPHQIAFCAINGKGEPESIYEGDLRGYNKVELAGLTYYVFNRLNGDGTPYRSEL